MILLFSSIFEKSNPCVLICLSVKSIYKRLILQRMRREAIRKGLNSQESETGLSAQSMSLERSNWFEEVERSSHHL
jgi:hypothetical protein